MPSLMADGKRRLQLKKASRLAQERISRSMPDTMLSSACARPMTGTNKFSRPTLWSCVHVMEENFTYSSLSPSLVGAPVVVSMLRISIFRQSDPPLQISCTPEPLAASAHLQRGIPPTKASDTLK